MPNHTMPKSFMTIFGWLTAVVIIAAILGGLLMTGGPIKARDTKIDGKKLRNMHMTARAISCYSDVNEGLPETLLPIKTALKDGFRIDNKNRRCRNLKWEVDPVTELDFEYNRLEKKSFELCGVFIRKGDERNRQTSVIYTSNQNNVLHTKQTRKSEGRHCYTAKGWS